MENKSKVPAAGGFVKNAPPPALVGEAVSESTIPVDVAAVMHGQMTASAAARNALALSAVRVSRAKAEVERISAAIVVEERNRSDLKAQRSSAVDEMEAAVQAHDIAVRADQAAR
jgi:hypothetical protein